MSYDPGIPNSADSPAIFPAQAQTNWGRLQTIIGADHQFNLPAGADDGYHTVVHMPPQSSPGALAGVGQLYGKTNQNVVPYWRYPDNGSGAVPECNLVPVLACGRWDENGAAVSTLFNCTGAKVGTTFTLTITSVPLESPATWIPIVTAVGKTGTAQGAPTLKPTITATNTLQVASLSSDYGISVVVYYLSIA